jgi:hypothetical protein
LHASSQHYLSSMPIQVFRVVSPCTFVPWHRLFGGLWCPHFFPFYYCAILTYILNYLLTYLLRTYFTYLLTCSLTYLLTYLFTYLPTHSLAHSLTHQDHTRLSRETANIHEAWRFLYIYIYIYNCRIFITQACNVLTVLRSSEREDPRLAVFK